MLQQHCLLLTFWHVPRIKRVSQFTYESRGRVSSINQLSDALLAWEIFFGNKSFEIPELSGMRVSNTAVSFCCPRAIAHDRLFFIFESHCVVYHVINNRQALFSINKAYCRLIMKRIRVSAFVEIVSADRFLAHVLQFFLGRPSAADFVVYLTFGWTLMSTGRAPFPPCPPWRVLGVSCCADNKVKSSPFFFSWV